MAKKRDQEEVPGGAQNASGAEARRNMTQGPEKQAAHPTAAAAGSPDSQPGGSGAPGASPSGGSPSAGPCGSAEDRITALEKEVAELQDKLLRKQADFENYRKRMIREREDAARYSNAALLTDIISLIDDFERAIKSAEESKDFPSFLQGLTMIEKQFVEVLESRWGLKRFTSVGEGFDPTKHEAVLRVEGPADGKPTVVEDYQKGYYLHERVLRPARVKVMVPAADAPSDGAGNSGGAPERPAGDGS